MLHKGLHFNKCTLTHKKRRTSLLATQKGSTATNKQIAMYTHTQEKATGYVYLLATQKVRTFQLYLIICTMKVHYSTVKLIFLYYQRKEKKIRSKS